MDYFVSVSNTFEAESPEDAVAQMAAWLTDYAYAAGYRVINDSDSSAPALFIDAESIDFDKLWSENV